MANNPNDPNIDPETAHAVEVYRQLKELAAGSRAGRDNSQFARRVLELLGELPPQGPWL
jgi:hypothetical protein